MALKVEYKDEHGVVQINMSPTPSCKEPDKDICDVPKFDTINNRFARYDLFGGKYDVDSGGETPRSLFRSRYNSIEEELANTPYAFTTERSLRLNSANKLDITIQSRLDDISPSKDIEDDRFFKRKLSLDYNDSIFGPQIDFKVTDTDTPAFTVTQLIHAQDRYFDLSGRQSESPCSAKVCSEVHVPSPRGDDEAFRVLGNVNKEAAKPVVPTPKRKKESSFAILAETPVSRPTSPRSLPVDIRARRISPFRGRGFREETSRHNTPRGSACNSRANSPPRRRTNSLSRLDMASTATLSLPIHTILGPHSPRNFLKENIDDVRELSELNREKHEAEAKRKRIEEEEALLKEMGLLNKSGSRSLVGSRTNSRSNSPNKSSFRSRSNSPTGMLRYENFRASREYINGDDGMRHHPVAHRSRVRTTSKSQPQSHDGSPKHSKIPTRQNSVSPTRGGNQKPVENGLNKKQRYISNSTSSIHDTVRVGNRVHDKRSSKSTQQLSISPTVKGKPPISPGRGGPPPSNKALNPKRLSPIVGTPSKSPADDVKPSSARVPLRSDTTLRMAAKTVGHTLAASRLNSRQPSRAASRDTSPEKSNQPGTRPGMKKMINRTMTIKNLSRTPSTNSVNETSSSTKPGLKKMINRTMTIKNLSSNPNTKNVNEISSSTKPGLKKMVNRTITIKNLSGTPSSSEVNETSPSRKPGLKKMVNRTITVKNLSRTPSAIDVNETSPLKSAGSKKNLANISQTLNKISDLSKKNEKNQGKVANKNTSTEAMSSDCDCIEKQDNETQYDKIANDKNELVIMTKKNIISMTTAAITSQPLEVLTKVSNQLPAAFEKAREKGIFERLNSKDSLGAENCGSEKQEHKKPNEEDDKKPPKHPKTTHDKITLDKVVHDKVIPEIKPAIDDNIKLRPLQPPYNNPQVERVKQKIEAILKEPEVSAENILTASAKSRDVKKILLRNLIQKAKEDDETSLSSKEPEVCITETKVDVEPIVKETKVDVKKTNDERCNKPTEVKDEPAKKTEIKTEEIRTEITKIVDSIITPVEQPKEEPPKVKVPEKLMEIKKDIEPIVTVVSEKRKHCGSEIAEKETLVKGDGEVEVQSSNVPTPGLAKFVMQKKAAEGNASELSSQSNGGLPQSTSTTPKPPVRTKKETKDKDKSPIPEPRAPAPPVHCGDRDSIAERPKDPNFCQRLINKCKSKCCTCCTKGDDDDEKAIADDKEKKGGVMSKLNCCKKNKEMAEEDVREMERAAGKASIEYESETKRTRKLRDVLCGCCGRSRRVADTGMVPRNVADSMSPAPEETGCCGRKKRIERRDSILSDRPPASCCGRMCTWFRGMCRRGHDSSRRPSMFSKNKSMSPTLPPEDTRKKLDTSLVEHTSVMRGAIPALPIVLAYFCLLCNILIPGLGTILSGMFCLCFGIPRFGVHDGAKHRLGSFVINLLVGAGQLFTVLFCLVGWGWSVWWGVIMLNVSRKYRKLKREAEAEEAEAAPPVTTNNHTRA